MSNNVVTLYSQLRQPLRVRSIGDLWDNPPLRPELILGSWLAQRHLSMVYSPAGCGKSFFTMSIATAVAGGGSLFGWKAPKPRKVLLVDGEMDLIDLHDRSRDLLTAVAEVDEQVVRDHLDLLAYHDQKPGTVFLDLVNSDDRDALLGYAEKSAAELVIFDNFSTLATVDDENAASSFDPFIDLMRQLKLAGRAAILVHHSRKNTKGESSFRGTSKMSVIFNTIIKLDNPDGMPSDGPARFDLVFEKFRGLRDGTTAPLRAELRGGDGRDRIWHVEPSPASLIKQLVALVRTVEFGTQDELAVELGVPQYQVSRLRKKAIASGAINAGEWANCLKMAREGDGNGDESLDADELQSTDF